MTSTRLVALELASLCRAPLDPGAATARGGHSPRSDSDLIARFAGAPSGWRMTSTRLVALQRMTSTRLVALELAFRCRAPLDPGTATARGGHSPAPIPFPSHDSPLPRATDLLRDVSPKPPPPTRSPIDRGGPRKHNESQRSVDRLRGSSPPNRSPPDPGIRRRDARASTKCRTGTPFP
jgi:hypothetical protein